MGRGRRSVTVGAWGGGGGLGMLAQLSYGEKSWEGRDALGWCKCLSSVCDERMPPFPLLCLPHQRALSRPRVSAARFSCRYNRGRKVAVDVASGLAFLHHSRALHLDLKPHNVLLGNGVAKIGDVGFARCAPVPLALALHSRRVTGGVGAVLLQATVIQEK